MYTDLAIVAVFAFIYSAIAGRVEKSIVSGPILFLAFGLICGPYGLGILNLDVDNIELRTIVDLTLALVLFIDAANADLGILRSNIKIPSRMLLVGMPLVIALGVFAGWFIFPEVSIFELCILATMLAATDAALGKGVITNQAVPSRIREGLNAESGLNDGLAVPVLFVFIALATGAGSDQGGTSMALGLVAQELGIGAVVGLTLTGVGVVLANWCFRRKWISEIWRQILVVALAIACFATAQSLHGSGYIAAFVGGLLFGRLAGHKTHEMVFAAEGIGELLALATWVMFGAAVVGQAWANMTWPIVVYSLLSLTVIRMLPMVASLAGTGENLESKLFLAWFGPRGLASIVFVIIVASYELPAYKTLELTVVCTVTLCVLAHGLTANAWAKGLGARSQKTPQADLQNNQNINQGNHHG
jgi:NhaP-type Na+/H+ or K+/H+ antiporter